MDKVKSNLFTDGQWIKSNWEEKHKPPGQEEKGTTEDEMAGWHH